MLAACASAAGVPATPTDSGPAPTDTLIAAPTSTPSLVPAPSTATATLVPEEGSWGQGPLDAAVHVVVYFDFQSPMCLRLAPILAQLLEMHPDDLRVSLYHFPLLATHDKASLAGQAAEAAGAQQAFWPMYDMLFGRYEEWVYLDPQVFTDWLVDAAAVLEMDLTVFEDDLRSGRYAQRMQTAFDEAIDRGIPGIPFLLINGQSVRIEPSLPNLEQWIRLELLETHRYSAYPPFVIDQETEYLAHLHLSIGEVVIQLYSDSAPLAVNNFVFLAREGWFDGVAIYRVNPGQFVESGDPSELGYGDPGYHFMDEIDSALDFDVPGMVAMSSTGPDTNGSRFLITLNPLSELTGTRTIFGQVVQGLDLLRSLHARDPIEDLLLPAEAFIRYIEIEQR